MLPIDRARARKTASLASFFFLASATGRCSREVAATLHSMPKEESSRARWNPVTPDS